MVEENTRKLLLEALTKTGENPEDVSCVYFFDSNGGSTASDNVLCLATKLPECELAFLFCNSKKYNYELIQTEREIKIETSPNTDPS